MMLVAGIGDPGFRIEPSKFTQNRHGDFLICEQRCIDADIRNFCVKRLCVHGRICENAFLGFFVLQQWSICLSREALAKSVSSSPSSHTITPRRFKISTFSFAQYDAATRDDDRLCCSARWLKCFCFRLRGISFRRVWQKFLESTFRSSKQRFRPYPAKPTLFVGADSVQRKICPRPSCQ